MTMLTYYSRYTKQTIADLLQNRVDMSQLVITKALAKAGGLKSDSVPDFSLTVTVLQIMPGSRHT